MKVLLSCFVVGMMLFVGTGNAATFLYFNSQPGDYIGQGIEQTWTADDGTFSAYGNAASNVVTIQFNGTDWWYLDFAAPSGEALQTGPYENATRYPFQSPTMPGLNIFGDGRGCNTLTGRFDVLEIAYSPEGEIERFAADFEQHCEGGTPALLGSIRYNATVGFPLRIDIKANGKDTPITVKVGDTIELSVLTDAGEDAGTIAEHWVGKSGPYGTQWLNSSGGWSVTTANPQMWFRGPVTTQQRIFSWTPSAPGAYLFQFAVDYTINRRLNPKFVDHVTVTVLENN